MSAMGFTPEERSLVRMYAVIPRSAWARVPGWLLEIGLPVACAAYGLVNDSSAFLFAAIGGLLGVNVVRTFYQFRYARLLSGIFAKVHAHLESTTP